MRMFVTLLFVAGFVAAPGVVSAHGFGERYDLPVPLELYLWGAAAAVILSFLIVGLLLDTAAPVQYPKVDLLKLPVLREILSSPWLARGLQGAAVLLFIVTILAGLFGDQAPAFNFAPTFIWVIWWIGMGYFSALIGNPWPVLNPWKTLFEWADALSRRRGDGLELFAPYPEHWGRWPALLLYFGFVWIEIVFEGSPVPYHLAAFALVYSAITWAGMAYFGKQAWLDRGEAFSVFFSLLGKFAPTELRVTNRELCGGCPSDCSGRYDCVDCADCFALATPEEREINFRPWGMGLLQVDIGTLSNLAFVVFMLASVTYDGFVVTPAWTAITTAVRPAMRPLGTWGEPLLQTIGLMVLPILFLGIYLAICAAMRWLGQATQTIFSMATTFIYTLIPIALAYQFAHYYTLFLIQGQSALLLLSDPFGWGWNLFGTADMTVNVGIVSASFVWYSQVAAIVLGHMVAVLLAHLIALRLFRSPRLARRSQYPMLALMVAYTMSSLWILSQPVVSENKAVSSKQAAASPSSPTIFTLRGTP